MLAKKLLFFHNEQASIKTNKRQIFTVAFTKFQAVLYRFFLRPTSNLFLLILLMLSTETIKNIINIFFNVFS